MYHRCALLYLHVLKLVSQWEDALASGVWHIRLGHCWAGGRDSAS